MTKTGDQVTIKGRKFSRRALRKFLEEQGFPDEIEPNADGLWESPITGELFSTRHQLFGHVGAYLRTPNRKDPTEPSRAGYVRALRAGLTPTQEQREAHSAYQRRYRKDSKEESPAQTEVIAPKASLESFTLD